VGTDVYTETGVIANTAELVNLVRKKDIRKIKELAYLCAEDPVFESWDAGKKSLLKIADATELEEMRERLEDMIVVHGQPSKYGSDDCYLEGAEELLFFWQQILEATRPTLPPLVEARVFDSGRMNGWDVEHGVACFIFRDADCFVQLLTKTGRALERALGHCNKKEWTIVSY